MPIPSMQGTREVSSFRTKLNVRNITGIKGAKWLKQDKTVGTLVTFKI